MEDKQFVISAVSELFTTYGIRSVTMDDIAKHLGRSKKTLYQGFATKDDLVTSVVLYMTAQANELQHGVLQRNYNAVRECYEMFECHSAFISTFNPAIIFDLQKYHQGSWKAFQDNKHSFVLNSVINNLKKGIDSGLYRSDFDPVIIGRLHVGRFELIFDQRLFPNNQFAKIDVMEAYVYHHLCGIVSDSGRDELKKLRIHKTEKDA